MNSNANAPADPSGKRDVPWWVKKPSTATWIAVAIAYGVFRRRFEPQVIDSLNWRRGQYLVALFTACAVVFALSVLLDRGLKKK